MLKSQFKIIHNDYFEYYPFNDKLNEKGKKLLTNYETCIFNNNNDKEKCEKEFDKFSQFYWPSHYSENYEELPGFERYLIQIDEDLVFQPSFITTQGILFSGTHYIVGGSYEDTWSIGLFKKKKTSTIT